MKNVLIGLSIFALIATIVLPLYLGPDDISGCQAPTKNGRCQTVDAIIAISGGDTSARTDEAIRLYKAGWSQLLIFSGAALDKSGPSNASVMRSHAIASGVPASSIVIEEESATTAENAANTAKLAKNLQLERIMLVTSAYHQRRASIEFAKAFGAAIAIVNHPVANDKQWSNWWWITPYGWWLGIGEVIKIVLSQTGSI